MTRWPRIQSALDNRDLRIIVRRGHRMYRASIDTISAHGDSIEDALNALEKQLKEIQGDIRPQRRRQYSANWPDRQAGQIQNVSGAGLHCGLMGVL
jgi:hypothetical protein